MAQQVGVCIYICMCMCIIYIHTYKHTYIRRYMHTNIRDHKGPFVSYGLSQTANNTYTFIYTTNIHTYIRGAKKMSYLCLMASARRQTIRTHSYTQEYTNTSGTEREPLVSYGLGQTATNTYTFIHTNIHTYIRDQKGASSFLWAQFDGEDLVQRCNYCESCVCMCVCVYIYIYIYIYAVCICVCVYVYLYIYIYIYMYIRQESCSKMQLL